MKVQVVSDGADADIYDQSSGASLEITYYQGFLGAVTYPCHGEVWCASVDLKSQQC